MTKPRIARNSILWKIIAIMAGTMLIQAALLFGTVFYGGTIDELQNNAFDILGEKVSGRKSDIEDNMVQRWSNLSEPVEMINSEISRLLTENGASYRELDANSELATQALAAVSDDLIYYLRRNSVTGAFIILNGSHSGELPTGDETQLRAGLYIRDFDPKTNPGDYSDLMIERGPSALVKSLGITTDTFWRPQFSVEEGENAGFFFQPFWAAQEHPDADVKDLGYWSPCFRMQDDANEIVTYSLPLIGENGEPYGVLGVELRGSYLTGQLPYTELNAQKQGCYLLGVSKDGGRTYQSLVSSGPYYAYFFGNDTQVALGQATRENVFHLSHDERVNDLVYGCVRPLKLYNTNTPFEGDQWAVIGVVDSKTLLSFSSTIQKNLLYALGLSLLVGLLGIIVMVMGFTRPITRLAQQVRDSDPTGPVKLDKINIAEIDDLSQAIETLSANVADSAAKLSQIMKMSSYNLGVFEFRRDQGQIFYTDGFWALLGRKDEDNKMSREQFRGIFEELEQEAVEIGEDRSRVYRIPMGNTFRWVKLRLIEDESKTLGVLTDVTGEYLEKQKQEYERDYDGMTNLPNRHAFHTRLQQLFEQKTFTLGAMLMMDLDNLKYINDSYGHDSGDEYIRTLADVLRNFIAPDSLAAHMVGGEFYLFIKGDSRAKIQSRISDFEKAVQKTQMRLPGGETQKLRLSAGIAWYPGDAGDYQQLIRYADFTLYRAKRTTKGRFVNFNLENYDQESPLYKNREELNKLIEEELVDYAFQPIVSTKDGGVFAYEALMRPQLPSLPTPMEVLAVAHFQSKLNEIERLSFFKSLEKFSALSTPGDSFKLFVNSIPNQIMEEKDVERFERRYHPYLNRLVVELTEEERQNENVTQRKRDYINSWGGTFALDDFGSGYNGESLLLDIRPAYIKIDRSIIHHIDRDASRLQIMRSILQYARQLGSHVIAEGVETKEEMEVLIQNGVEYLQGYYLCRPASDLPKVSPEVVRQIRKVVAEQKV